MSGARIAINLTTVFLRLGAAAYVFSTMFPYFIGPEGIRLVLMILMAVVALLFFIVEKKYFFQYCFIVVLFCALFNLFQTVTSDSIWSTIFGDIFALSVCCYMLTRDLRKKYGSSRHSRSEQSGLNFLKRSKRHHHHHHHHTEE